MTSWLKARFGRMRVSTVVLIVAFVALFWVYHNFEPRPAPPEAPPTAVVPPGFVPDPNYTWVPRTNVRRAQGARDHHDDHTDHHQPDRDHDDVTWRDHQPDVADGVHADDDRRQAGDHQPDADPHADDHTGGRVGTGADDAGSAEIALSGFRPRHRYTGVP